MTPSVHLYATCWNDVRQLEFFFRHYDPTVERYVIFDDDSTDGSLELLRGHPRVDVRRFARTIADSFVLSELDLFNSCWKESRGGQGTAAPADWVIVCSLDEHLVHRDFSAYLLRCSTAGITVIPALGFQMVTDEFPKSGERLCETRTWGVAEPYDCKLSVFCPTAIQEINYEEGGHVAAPVGRVLAPRRDELLLQHYQLLGLDYTVARFAELRTGLGPLDRARGWGTHYDQSRQELAQRLADYGSRAVNTSVEASIGYRPPKWWTTLPRL